MALHGGKEVGNSTPSVELALKGGVLLACNCIV